MEEMKTVHTKEFEKSRLALHRSGAKSVINKLNALLVQLHTGDPNASTFLTNYGESRLPHALKYDLGDGYRLVTQVFSDAGAQARVMCFVGSHDEAEIWLERHRGYRYVVDPKDKRIELVPVDVPMREAMRAANAELAESVAEQPLLRHLKGEDWQELDVPGETKARLLELTHLDFADSTVEDLLGRVPPVVGEVLFDVMVASNDGDLDKIRARIELFRGKRRRATEAEVIDAIARPINADQFITFDDPEELQELLRKESWEAWMLFLHPVQLEIAQKQFHGPARVRGVSGSGKTSVLIHRARALARRYRAPILVVTLTQTLAELLEHLLGQLCGVERSLIRVSTPQSLAHEVLFRLKPADEKALRRTPDQETLRAWRVQAVRDARNGTQSFRSVHQGLDRQIDELMTDVREDYMEGEREQLLGSGGGRGASRLSAVAKSLALDAARLYEERLREKRTLDHAGLVLLAVHAAAEFRNVAFDFAQPSSIRSPFARCVLVDEAQDLSLNELRLLQALTDHTQQDALFLTGDSAQRVYRRRSELKSLGIDVRGRAFILRKNYRNTSQVFRASRTLLDAFDIDELDDETERGRIPADYAAREGDRPMVLRFERAEDEVKWIAEEISRMRRLERGILGAGTAVVSPSPWHRERIAEHLQSIGVPVCSLRDDVVASSEPVKISTIESAKGHEFSAVFIAGLSGNIIPSPALDEDEHVREVGRLYVAMTRARERLIMSWSRDRGGPSQFLVAMLDSVRESRYDGSQLRDETQETS